MFRGSLWFWGGLDLLYIVYIKDEHGSRLHLTRIQLVDYPAALNTHSVTCEIFVKKITNKTHTVVRENTV